MGLPPPMAFIHFKSSVNYGIIRQFISVVAWLQCDLVGFNQCHENKVQINPFPEFYAMMGP